MTAAAVSAIGRNRTAPASTTASRQRHSLLQPQLDEVDEDDRVPHDDSGAGDEADHRSRGEEGAHRRVRGQNADERKGNRGHDESGVANDWNQPTTRM